MTIILGGVILSELMMAWWSFRKPLNGLCLLLAIRLLVPDICRAIVMDLSLNTMLTIILATGVLWRLLNGRVSHREFKQPLFRFIIAYTVISFIIMLIPNSVPFMVQLTSYIQFFVCQILPALLMMILITTHKDLMRVLKVMFYSISICMGYGIISILLGIPFLYNTMFIDMFGTTQSVENFSESINSVMGGIQGRIVGTCVGRSYAFGMIAPVVFAMVWCIWGKTGIKRLKWLTLLCAIATLFTVRRSPIIAAMIFMLFLFLRKAHNEKIKMVAYALIGLVAVYGIIVLFPYFSNFQNIIESSLFFWDEGVSTQNGISGSSVSFRSYQLQYTLRQIADSPLIGNGLGSCFYKGLHPTMIGWESIVFTTLMQGGIYGAIMTILLYYHMYRYSIQRSQDTVYELAFILSAITLCVFTDTIYPFFIFCGCILMNKLNTLRPNDRLQKATITGHRLAPFSNDPRRGLHPWCR